MKNPHRLCLYARVCVRIMGLYGVCVYMLLSKFRLFKSRKLVAARSIGAVSPGPDNRQRIWELVVTFCTKQYGRVAHIVSMKSYCGVWQVLIIQSS